jgi:hypothetical protein
LAGLLMALPPPDDTRRVPTVQRPIAFVAVLGGGLSLVFVVVGLAFLGWTDRADAQIASTGLATIGATLAGAFASWMGGQGAPRRQDHEERERDAQP